MSNPSTLANEIESIIRRELDDCERLIKREEYRRALMELDYAMRKLRNVAHQVRQLNPRS